VIMSTKVRIYRPAKSAMQSGHANTRQWLVETIPTAGKQIDPLMGWTGSADTDTQVKLRFESRDDAIAYAVRNDFPYEVEEPKKRIVQFKNYADNFSPNRLS